MGVYLHHTGNGIGLTLVISDISAVTLRTGNLLFTQSTLCLWEPSIYHYMTTFMVV